MRKPFIWVAGLAAGALLVPGPASADIYWTHLPDAVATAANDGSGVNQTFVTGGSQPTALAVGGKYVYWTNLMTRTVGRGRTDGTDVDQAFIAEGAVYGVAVDHQYVYWSNYSADRIGRARLDGTDVDQAFITGANDPTGMYADGRYVYWANNGNGTIGRARTNGTQVNQEFITGCGSPLDVHVLGARIYWINNTLIGRAAYDGTGVDQTFLETGGFSRGLAANSTHLFWSLRATGDVARSRLDGGAAVTAFVPDVVPQWDVAVTPDPVRVRAKAKNRRSKLLVNVNPDLSDIQAWRFQVLKKRKGGGWKTLSKVYATQGDEQTRKVNLRKGKYRAKVLPGYGYAAARSNTVRLRR